MHQSQLLPPLKQGGYDFTCVCLSVCPLDYILMKVFVWVGIVHG